MPRIGYRRPGPAETDGNVVRPVYAQGLKKNNLYAWYTRTSRNVSCTQGVHTLRLLYITYANHFAVKHKALLGTAKDDEMT